MPTHLQERHRQLAPARRLSRFKLWGRLRDVCENREPPVAAHPAPRPAALAVPSREYLPVSSAFPRIFPCILGPPVEARGVARVPLVAVDGDDRRVRAVDSLLAGQLGGPDVQEYHAHAAHERWGRGALKVKKRTRPISAISPLKSGRCAGGTLPKRRRSLRARPFHAERPEVDPAPHADVMANMVRALARYPAPIAVGTAARRDLGP